MSKMSTALREQLEKARSRVEAGQWCGCCLANVERMLDEAGKGLAAYELDLGGEPSLRDDVHEVWVTAEIQGWLDAASRSVCSEYPGCQ